MIDINKKYFGFIVDKYVKEYYLGFSIMYHNHFFENKKESHSHVLLELIFFFIELRIGRDEIEEKE